MEKGTDKLNHADGVKDVQDFNDIDNANELKDAKEAPDLNDIDNAREIKLKTWAFTSETAVHFACDSWLSWLVLLRTDEFNH